MNFRILAVGEILWDLLPSGKQLGGAPANFAYHAHALGAAARIVSRRSRAAIVNLPGAFLRWLSKSASVHPNRCNSSAMIRSALSAACARRKSPA